MPISLRNKSELYHIPERFIPIIDQAVIEKPTCRENRYTWRQDVESRCSFGMLADDKVSDSRVFIKFLPPNESPAAIVAFMREFIIRTTRLQLSPHEAEHIVGHKDLTIDKQYGLGVVLPFYKNNTLGVHIDDLKETYKGNYGLSADALLSMAIGLEIMRRKSLIHNDCKPDNYMVAEISANCSPQLALADFGTSAPFAYYRKRKTAVSYRRSYTSAVDGSGDPEEFWNERFTPVGVMSMTTIQYAPPELWNDDISPGHKSDLYQLAVTGAEMLLGKNQFIVYDTNGTFDQQATARRHEKYIPQLSTVTDTSTFAIPDDTVATMNMVLESLMAIKLKDRGDKQPQFKIESAGDLIRILLKLDWGNFPIDEHVGFVRAKQFIEHTVDDLSDVDEVQHGIFSRIWQDFREVLNSFWPN